MKKLMTMMIMLLTGCSLALADGPTTATPQGAAPVKQAQVKAKKSAKQSKKAKKTKQTKRKARKARKPKPTPTAAAQ